MAVEEYTLIITEAGSAVPADASVTLAKHSDFNAYSVLGRNSGTAGTPAFESCTVYGFDWLTSTNAADAISKLGLTFPIATSDITDAAVTLAKLANLGSYTIIGRNSALTGVPVAEPCTSYGFDFLTATSAADARSKIGVSLPLSVSNGGSGTTSLTGILVGNGTSAFSTVTAPSGTIVGTTDTQTLTNKTLSGATNTITNVSLTTGVTGTLPVANGGTGAATLTGILVGNGTSPFTVVTAPSGTIVGTSDTQTLTNKTISGASNTITNVSLTTGVTGTLPEANGGTGKTDLFGGTNTWTAPNTFNGDVVLDKTITAAATTGAQTIDKNAGSVNFAAAATSLVVTNSRVTANSVIIATVATNDAAMTSVQAVAAAGSFTLYADSAADAETRVNWIVIN